MEKNRDKIALGIDLGGTKILTAVVDNHGNILSRDYALTLAKNGPESVIKSILKSAGHVIDRAKITTESITAIGIGAPGLSNPESGILFTSPNLPNWHDVPLKDIIQKELVGKAFLINDANAAAFGELHFGAGKGVQNLIYITISTGIGSGIIIDGKIYSGSIGTAGELGHMVIDDDGPVCSCGNRGCWETLASGTALAQEAKHRIKDGAITSILDYTDGNTDSIDAKIIQKAAKAGDKLALNLIERTAYYFGVGLSNIVNIFNPELIIIGGGLSNLGDMLFQPALEEAKRRAFKQPLEAVRFSRASLGSNSGVLGAAVFALKQANDTS